jgi:hypothetical protein
MDKAKAFLLQCLKDGPQPCTRIKDAAQQRGISSTTLERARQELGVDSLHAGGLAGGGEWVWCPPADKMMVLDGAASNSLLTPKTTNDYWSGRERQEA